MTDRPRLSLDVVSDVVCPWCYVGRTRLKAALAGIDDIEVAVNWRPFQLDPTIPEGGKDRQQYLLDKFKDPQRIQAMHEKIEETGRSDGIDFHFDRISISPNTLDAHRVVRWSASAGNGIQDRLVGLLFKRYFEEGADIGDHVVLVQAAADAGMDATVVETLLPTDADRIEVHNEIATAQRMGVTGVPCFLLEGRYAIVGAQPVDALADAIRQVAAAKERGELDQPVEPTTG